MLIVSGLAAEPAHQLAGHPERPARMGAVAAGLDDLALGDELELLAPRLATVDELSRAHDRDHLAKVAAFCQSGGGALDPDTYATDDSWSAACRAAGAGLAAIDALAGRADGVAFVAIRPPGHHALADRSMGFCLLNNIAVAAATLRANGERVLIVDWDVHHGNGTQAIFWNDPDVLYVSTHQWPLYPGGGAASEIGGGAGRGATVNLPLPPGATGDVVLQAIQEVAIPVIESFDPTWVLVSAGFDAHRADPLAELNLSNGDFAELARVVAGLAGRSGRLALFLEGGYDLEALRTSVRSTVGALMGDDASSEPSTTGGPGADMVRHAGVERTAALDALGSA